MPPQGGRATPKWRADLRSILGAPVASARNALWFTDNNTIVATWVTPKAGQELRLRLAVLEAATGRVLAAPDWPTGAANAHVIVAHDGKFVLQAGDELTLYGSDLKPLKKLKLPALAQADWSAYPSPSGRHVLFVPPMRRLGTWLWLDTDTFQIVQSWEDLRTGDVSVADGRIARTASASNVEVAEIGKEWKTIAPGARRIYVRFVGEDLLYVAANPNRLLRPDGQVVFTSDEPSVRCLWGIAFPAAGGHRFVVPECAVKGAIPALDIGGHSVLERLYVHDGDSGGWSYALDMRGPGVKGLAQGALSPDGSQFAILSGDAVESFSLPPVQ
ncbi:MAG: hypothetical protein ABSF54_10675 [Bryobacteraceae bacterium]|jgi:hypothetical protein